MVTYTGNGGLSGMEYSREKIARTIRALRALRDISESILSVETGINQTRIWRIENAKADITLRESLKISQYFDISIEEFIGDKLDIGG